MVSEVNPAQLARLRTVRLDNLRLSLGRVSTDVMRGDNLAITLCSAFEDADEAPDDETGWTPSAITGCEQVLDAIHLHYAETIASLSTRVEALTQERDEARAALEPFARAHGVVAALEHSDDRWPDESTLDCDENVGFAEFVKVGDLRQARAALARIQQGATYD